MSIFCKSVDRHTGKLYVANVKGGKYGPIPMNSKFEIFVLHQSFFSTLNIFFYNFNIIFRDSVQIINPYKFI